MSGPIWIIAEHKEKVITEGTLEAISAGKIISTQLKAEFSVVVLGHGIEKPAKGLSQTGVDTIHILDEQNLAQYTSDAYLAAVDSIIKTNKPWMLFIPSTCLGRDLAPKLAARLKTPFLADVSGIEVGNNEVIFHRPVYGGRLMSAVTCAGEKPWIVTLRPRAFEKTESAQKTAKMEKPAVAIPASNIRTIIKGVEKTQKGLGLTEADIIVSGGRGMKGPENFKILEELAGILGGVVGASGAAVDAGWMPHSAQVGQTGKVVSPKLYIACGISGAPQHLAGMSTSKCIVAINKDPDAPIFKAADYGVVGDIFEVVPMLIKELKR